MDESSYLSFDAAFSAPPSLAQVSSNITLEMINDLESNLEFYEVVSLVFLLYDDANTALARLHTAQIGGVHAGLIFEWVCFMKDKNSKWQHILLEALTIVQCYSSLKKLGYSKNDMYQRFLPLNDETSIFIHPIKKALYRFCEDMSPEITELFLDKVNQDIREKRLDIDNSVENIRFDKRYLEIHILYWITINYINISKCQINNLINMKRIIKELGMTPFYERLECCEMRTNKAIQLKTDNKDLAVFSLSNFATGLGDVKSIASSVNRKKDKLKRYKMDPKNAGIVIIINQKDFQEAPFENRYGTDVDRDKLIAVWSKFGFKCIVLENLESTEFLLKLNDSISNNFKDQHCCLVVVILSHGAEGSVFGIDCERVSITDIEEIILSPMHVNLLMKPKVLIIQACQGTDREPVIPIYKNNQIENSDTITTDGLLTTYPKTADFLKLYAAPNAAAIRDTQEGSWLITCLCKWLEREGASRHFEEILTFVKDQICDRRWRNTCMVPQHISTFRRCLYLVPLNSNVNVSHDQEATEDITKC